MTPTAGPVSPPLDGNPAVGLTPGAAPIHPDPDAAPGPATQTELSEKRGDVVYTPDWCARDMVEHFKPTGRILDPCKGKGVFLDHLPVGARWCEISDGVDFFTWHEPVDWVIGNPPYSMTRPWFRHSYTIADNLVYLVPLRNVFSGYGFLREIHEFGGIRAIRTYGTGGRLGFPMGNAVGAMHIERGYTGATDFTFYDEPASTLFDLGGAA